MTSFALIVAWAVLFSLRLFLGGDGGALDEMALWTLRILTLVLAVRLLVSAARFGSELVADARDGKPVFTHNRVRIVLTALLTLGLACRVLTWRSGRQGALGWIGAILVCLSVIGLGLLYVQHVHRVRRERLSYWHPYLTIVLLGAWVASVIALGAVRPTGTIGGVLVGLFWLSLVALVVQVSGRRMQRRQ